MKIVFLDRDGVINQYPGDNDYVIKVKDLHILPKVLPAIKRLKNAKYKVFIISNQACVGRGIILQKKLDQITAKFVKAARQKGIKFDGIYYCTHRPDENCACRKPEIGNIKKVLARLGKSSLSLKNSFFIGDTQRDVNTGYNAGIKTILVETGRDRFKSVRWGKQKPHYVAADLQAAVDIILKP